ncbi:MAG: hypothetical protein ACM3NE_05900, partial [Hyphomicrobiales bacterium]
DPMKHQYRPKTLRIRRHKPVRATGAEQTHPRLDDPIPEHDHSPPQIELQSFFRTNPLTVSYASA